MVDGKRRKVIENSLSEKAFQNSARAELDNRIARMFYTSGLPFHFARNPNYRNSYAYAAIYNIPGGLCSSWIQCLENFCKKKELMLKDF